MRSDDVNHAVNVDLLHIPRGGLEQNALRASYNAVRRRDLAADPLIPRGLSLSRAVQAVVVGTPDFTPRFDRDYFGPAVSWSAS